MGKKEEMVEAEGISEVIFCLILNQIFVGPIGCRPYSGFSVFSFFFFFFNFGFLLLLLSTLSGILVCHIAEEVRGLKCGDSKSC